MIRWRVIAALVLVFLFGACAVRTPVKPKPPKTPPSAAPTTVRTTVPSSPPSSGPATTSSTAVPSVCGLHPSGTWAPIGTVHTIVPGEAPLRVVVTPDPPTVCPGGTVQMTIDIENTSSDPVDTYAPELVLSGGMNKWGMSITLDRIVLGPGESMTAVETVTLPFAKPATYGLSLRGYGPGGSITLV